MQSNEQIERITKGFVANHPRWLDYGMKLTFKALEADGFNLTHEEFQVFLHYLTGTEWNLETICHQLNQEEKKSE